MELKVKHVGVIGILILFIYIMAVTYTEDEEMDNLKRKNSLLRASLDKEVTKSEKLDKQVRDMKATLEELRNTPTFEEDLAKCNLDLKKKVLELETAKVEFATVEKKLENVETMQKRMDKLVKELQGEKDEVNVKKTDLLKKLADIKTEVEGI